MFTITEAICPATGRSRCVHIEGLTASDVYDFIMCMFLLHVAGLVCGIFMVFLYLLNYVMYLLHAVYL